MSKVTRAWIATSLLLGAGCLSLKVVHRDEDVAAIRRASETFNAASAAKDAAAMAQIYAPDVVVISPQGPTAVVGRADNQERFDRLFHSPGGSHTLTTDSITVSASGDLAYSRGKWHAGFDGPSGRVEGAGEYVAIWRPVSGGWKMTFLMAHQLR
jgi:uncharacterized protein (TIGR02246 family)